MRLTRELNKVFVKYSPNWMFTFVQNNFLYKYKYSKILKSAPTWLNKECYLIKGKDLSLYSPTPKFYPFTIPEWERKFEKYFKLEKGMTFLDIGACIGDTALPPLSYKENIKVIAVEPDPMNITYLKGNLNEYINAGKVAIHPIGIWDEVSEIKFHMHEIPTGHSLIPNKERHSSIMVKTDTLDGLFWRGVDFAKIDIQGAEMQVFSQAARFLSNTNRLIVEAHHKTAYHPKTHGHVISVLKEHYNHIRYDDGYNLVYAWRTPR
jgi:FkbM family methyltransferase